MGIDLYCNNKMYSCSYEYWNGIRETIIRATFEHVHDNLILYKNKSIDIEKKSQIYSNCYIDIIETLMYEIIEKKTKDENISLVNFFIQITQHISKQDALILYDLYGLYALCNKSDSEGFYSPGNSLDICKLLKLIKPYIVNKYNYRCIYDNNGLYEIFTESFTKNINIVIT